MYIQRNTYSAAIGKGEDLRQLLNEAIIGYQADGIRIGLSRLVYGEAGQLTTITVCESLAELQATRERILAGSAYRTRVAQTIPLLSRQPVSSLVEPIIPFPEGGTTNRWGQRVVFTPLVGKLPELRSILEERVRARQAEVRISLAQTVFGAEQALILNLSLPDFAAIDALRESNRTDPNFIAFQERIQPLLARAGELSLHEILVPVQPARAREMAGAATR